MINNKFQSFMLATIALALCILAGDKIYDTLVPEARAGSYRWACGRIDHTGDTLQRILNQENIIQVSLVQDPSPGSAGIFVCTAS